VNAKHLKVESTTREEALNLVDKFLTTFDFKFPAVIRIDPKGNSKDYKALVAIWSREAAEQFSARDKNGKTYKDTEIRELWYHMFIGYHEPKLIGRTEIGARLGNIADFGNDRGKCYDFARKVEEWCSSVGVQLSHPESEYQRDKARQAG